MNNDSINKVSNDFDTQKAQIRPLTLHYFGVIINKCKTLCRAVDLRVSPFNFLPPPLPTRND